MGYWKSVENTDVPNGLWSWENQNKIMCPYGIYKAEKTDSNGFQILKLKAENLEENQKLKDFCENVNNVEDLSIDENFKKIYLL